MKEALATIGTVACYCGFQKPKKGECAHCGRTEFPCGCVCERRHASRRECADSRRNKGPCRCHCHTAVQRSQAARGLGINAKDDPLSTEFHARIVADLRARGFTID